MNEKKFKEILDDGIEGKYWKPNHIGTNIEGTVLELEEGEYGLQTTIQTSDEYETTLPAHTNLQRKLKQVDLGDYIRVTLKDIQKSNNPKYSDKLLYKVEVEEEDEVLSI